MTTIKPIRPFFNDATKTAPPPFPPLLTDQQELFVQRARSDLGSAKTGLLADEAVCARNASSGKPDPKIKSPCNIPISRGFKLARRVFPYSKEVGEKEATTIESSDASDESSTDTHDTSSNLSEDSKIPRPTGQPGRSGRSGYYSLETTLSWNHKAFSKLKVRYMID